MQGHGSLRVHVHVNVSFATSAAVAKVNAVVGTANGVMYQGRCRAEHVVLTKRPVCERPAGLVEQEKKRRKAQAEEKAKKTLPPVMLVPSVY